MSLTGHLRELRTRLLIAIATVGALSVLLFWPSSYIIRWMEDTYLRGVELHAFGLADGILIEVKLSIIGGVILGLPVLLYQIWMFVVPAFHPKTRQMVYAYVAPSVVLALMGLAFAHFVVIPRVVNALIGITKTIAVPTYGISETLGFLMIFFAIFALIFQLPVIMVALARIGIVNAGMLQKYRRHALFGFVVAAGVVAPDGNPITMALMALPMYILFEASIWIIVVLEKSWKRSGVRA